jgi:hypothetical protein
VSHPNGATRRCLVAIGLGLVGCVAVRPVGPPGPEFTAERELLSEVRTDGNGFFRKGIHLHVKAPEAEGYSGYKCVRVGGHLDCIDRDNPEIRFDVVRSNGEVWLVEMSVRADRSGGAQQCGAFEQLLLQGRAQFGPERYYEPGSCSSDHPVPPVTPCVVWGDESSWLSIYGRSFVEAPSKSEVVISIGDGFIVPQWCVGPSHAGGTGGSAR